MDQHGRHNGAGTQHERSTTGLASSGVAQAMTGPVGTTIRLWEDCRSRHRSATHGAGPQLIADQRRLAQLLAVLVTAQLASC